MERSISPIHWVVLVAAFTVTWWTAKIQLRSDKRFLAPPPEHMELFTFGFADAFADSLWLRWIQDSDYCQTYAGIAPAKPIEEKDDTFKNVRNKICDNSWSFKMLDAITRIAPRFRMAYANGAISLSVLVEDYEGAKVIFDRGTAAFPNDWDILYQASYHYLFDRHDLKTAADLLDRARKAGGPWWFSLLASKLYSKSGQIEIGIKTLRRYRETLKDERQIKDLDQRIETLEKQLK